MSVQRWLYHKRSRRLYGDNVQQSHVALWFYEQLVHAHWTEWIIEVGMGCCASSAYFSTLAFCKGIPYLGIDDFEGDYQPPVYNLDRNLEVVKRMEGRVLKGDEFSAESIAAIKEVGADRPGFVLCDGGDKPKEIMELAPLCCPGSIVIGHDWRLSPEKYSWTDKDLVDRSKVDFYEPWHSKSIELATCSAVLRVK